MNTPVASQPMTADLVARLESAADECAKDAPLLREAASALRSSGEAVLSAKPLEWKEESPGWWSDASMGFNVEHNADPDEAPENRYTATWGEGDSEHFATLEEAKTWCQELADGWVRDCGQVTTPPTSTKEG